VPYERPLDRPAELGNRQAEIRRENKEIAIVGIELFVPLSQRILQKIGIVAPPKLTRDGPAGCFDFDLNITITKREGELKTMLAPPLRARFDPEP
jgi:hypothetical protein